MERFYAVAVVTLLCCVTTLGMGIYVARTHRKTGIIAPAMTGDPLLERAIRGHSNTLEWLPIFLVSMWLFTIYWSPVWTAVLGFLWMLGRIAYFVGYVAEPLKRYPGFFIQTMVTLILLFGALGRILYLWFA